VTPPSRDDPERLIVAWNSSATPLEVFKELQDPMRQAARRGLRFVLSQAANEDDVDDAVARAFSEVLKNTSDEVKKDPVAFAKVVARLRGVDRGRAIIREREKVKGVLREADRHRVTDEDLAAAAAKERLLRAAEKAMEELTAEQRDVIERTVMGRESLSNWTLERGTSYEAGRRLRARGLEALRKQINGGDTGRPEGGNADG
jgi:DNA-directed RNA polymerase specialized sigma24 family protein